MTTRRSVVALLALTSAVTLAACTAQPSGDRPVPTASSTPVAVAAIAVGDGSLRIATVFDRADPAVAAAEVAGVELAVREINEQGGVAGSDVLVVHRTPETDPAALVQDFASRTIDVVLWGSQAEVPAAVADPLAATSTVVVRTALPTTTPDDAFASRLRSADPGLSSLQGGAEAYDATIRLALAALAAGNDSGPAVAANLERVVNGSFPCATFGECAAAIADGVGVAYTGATGTGGADPSEQAPAAAGTKS
ncbi:MAG: hypothetical protein ABWY36_07575 [Leifsonia sp.]